MEIVVVASPTPNLRRVELGPILAKSGVKIRGRSLKAGTPSMNKDHRWQGGDGSHDVLSLSFLPLHFPNLHLPYPSLLKCQIPSARIISFKRYRITVHIYIIGYMAYLGRLLHDQMPAPTPLISKSGRVPRHYGALGHHRGMDRRELLPFLT